jgi:hypothetical protein
MNKQKAIMETHWLNPKNQIDFKGSQTTCLKVHQLCVERCKKLDES